MQGKTIRPTRCKTEAEASDLEIMKTTDIGDPLHTRSLRVNNDDVDM